MARRLGPKPPDTPARPAPTQFIGARTKGLQLIAGLQPIALERIVKIDTPEGYLEMDAQLAKIRNMRAQWRLVLEPIAGPLERAIQKQKEALVEAKKAIEGVKQLDGEVGAKFDILENHVKLLMTNYKAEEKRLIEEAKQTQAREAQRLKDEASKKAIQAAAAKTPQLKARLEQQRAEIEAQAQHVEMQAEALAPVKGASSSSRTQQKVRISDPIAFLRAVKDYQPTSGVYEIGVPPLMTTDRKGDPSPLVEIVSARLTDLFREQPGVVASWPGVTLYDDITIAGR